MKKIGIIMGSASDLPAVEKAMTTLEQFEVPYEVHVYSAHRTPAEVKEFTVDAREKGFGAIIAAAGKAAHLAGAIAASTTLPVIVAVNGSENAALLAIQMLAIEDKELADKLDAQRKSAAEKVLRENKEIEDKYNK